MKPVLLCACAFACVLALASCVGDPPDADLSPPAEPSASEPSASEPSVPPVSEEPSLPPSETILLVYTDYLTVQTTQNGIAYTYTYCFDDDGNVFNAEADLCFPDEASSRGEYRRLRALGYPNLAREGTSVRFCFPRKECPFYGISYRALEVLIAEETVYEVVEAHLPEPAVPSAEPVA